MKRNSRRVALLLVIAGLVVLGLDLGFFGGSSKTAAGTPSKAEPATVEHLAGGLNRIVLSSSAAKRLDIQTTPVRSGPGARIRQKIVPYSAVIYGLHGETWTYTNPKRLVYIRHRISVDHVNRNIAVLSHGPRVGTPVVTVGVAELFGIDAGIAEE
jgi:hypothetical protein